MTTAVAGRPAITLSKEDEHKLFFLGVGNYAQYDSTKPIPEELERYILSRDGALPPYMILPSSPVEFDLSDGDWSGKASIRWSGKGPLPPDVLSFVVENGVLPQRKGEADDERKKPARRRQQSSAR